MRDRTRCRVKVEAISIAAHGWDGIDDDYQGIEVRLPEETGALGWAFRVFCETVIPIAGRAAGR